MSTNHLFITGVSSGFGRAIAVAALARGHRVTGTVRDDTARAAFDALSSDGAARAVVLDVTDHAAIERVVTEIDAGLVVDILVNNAGYGHEGIFEESPIAGMRRQFEVNVFGAVAVMQAFVPLFRTRRRGRIVNITSMGGLITMPGIAYYCGSKFALEGISDVVGKELAGFGIFVTAVEPGSFRTDWAGRSMTRSPRSIADYDDVMDPIRDARAARSGRQPGDPSRAANVIVSLLDHPSPPTRLLLGSDALSLVRAHLTARQTEISAWEETTVSTDG